MSDSIIIPSQDEPFEGLQPVGAPESVAPPDVPEAVEEAPPAAEPDMFPREYVEELRREAAQYRTQYREVEQKFEGYTADERAALLDYIQLTRRAEAGDPTAEQALREMFGDPEPAAAEPEPIQFDEQTFRQLAREEAARLVQEQSAQQAQVQAVQGVQSRATELGYTVGSEDYILLLKFANEVESDDPLAEGDARVKAYKQQIIDAHLKSIQTQNEQIPSPVPVSGTAPSQINTPRTFAEAREAMHERLTRAHG